MNLMRIKEQDFLTKAKAYSNPENRAWLLVGIAKPYGGESKLSQVKVWALEGTPIRGFIIEWKDSAVRLDSYGKRQRTFHRHVMDKSLFRTTPNIGT